MPFTIYIHSGLQPLSPPPPPKKNTKKTETHSLKYFCRYVEKFLQMKKVMVKFQYLLFTYILPSLKAVTMNLNPLPISLLFMSPFLLVL